MILHSMAMCSAMAELFVMLRGFAKNRYHYHKLSSQGSDVTRFKSVPCGGQLRNDFFLLL